MNPPNYLTDKYYHQILMNKHKYALKFNTGIMQYILL